MPFHDAQLVLAIHKICRKRRRRTPARAAMRQAENMSEFVRNIDPGFPDELRGSPRACRYLSLPPKSRHVGGIKLAHHCACKRWRRCVSCGNERLIHGRGLFHSIRRIDRYRGQFDASGVQTHAAWIDPGTAWAAIELLGAAARAAFVKTISFDDAH